MKTLILTLCLLSPNAFALDMDAVKETAAKAADKGKEVFSACKKEQVEHCKSYLELAPLKECLVKNKEKLSEPCKKAISL
ncbi:MAG: hypothetical protein KF789_04760 [Bdellovibrionaceae bacterium]|nr:hypothetical protein [Pseudobdellovibrionaceae bacterium]